MLKQRKLKINPSLTTFKSLHQKEEQNNKLLITSVWFEIKLWELIIHNFKSQGKINP